MKTLKEKIAEGKMVNGTMLRFVRNPAVAYLAQQAGLDFLMLDCEHASYSLETIHDIAATAKALGIICMARVQYLREEYIGLLLENGMEGIQCPMVETVEQARELVRCVKYPPEGERGFSANTLNTGYAAVKHVEMMRENNARNMTIAQIETKLGVEHAREIAGVEGIDCLLIGPNDLSISLGAPGDTTNPIVLDAIAAVADACEAQGKLFALHADAKLCDRIKDRLSLNVQKFDVNFLVDGFKSVVKYGETIAEARKQTEVK